MCNTEQESDVAGRTPVRRGRLLVASTPVQGVPHCWNTTWIPLVYHCLPALIDLPDTWCVMSSPAPLPDHTVENQWVWRHKHSSPCLCNGHYIPQVYIFELRHSPTCGPSTCCLLRHDNSRVIHHFVYFWPSSTQRFHASSHAAGPSYQTTVNLSRGASRPTWACLRCLLAACFWPWICLILPGPARRCCPVCHPHIHVVQPTLSKSRDLFLACPIYQCSPRASFVSYSHVHSADTFLFSEKPTLQSCHVCTSHPRRSTEKLHLLSGLVYHAVPHPLQDSDPLHSDVPKLSRDTVWGGVRLTLKGLSQLGF